MRAIRKFTVRTSLPERLRRLEQLASNLRWSWHEPTRELFREISLEGWRATGRWSGGGRHADPPAAKEAGR